MPPFTKEQLEARRRRKQAEAEFAESQTGQFIGKIGPGYERVARLGGLGVELATALGQTVIDPYQAFREQRDQRPGARPLFEAFDRGPEKALFEPPDVTDIPGALRTGWEQLTQGEGLDIDAALDAYEEEAKAGWGYRGGTQIAAEVLAPGGLAKIGTRVIAKAPQAGAAFARFAPEALRPGVTRAVSETARRTGQALRVPWEVEEAIGRAATLPVRAGWKRLRGGRPSVEEALPTDMTPEQAAFADEIIGQPTTPTTAAAPTTGRIGQAVDEGIELTPENIDEIYERNLEHLAAGRAPAAPVTPAARVGIGRITGKRSSEEWSKLYESEEGIKILDPDGWDRANYTVDWNKPITQAQFERKLADSTVQRLPSGPAPGAAPTRTPVFHGTRDANPESFIDKNGDLVLRASENFEGRTIGVSFSESQDTALDYASRIPSTGPARSRAQGAIFEIDADAMPWGRMFRESGEEIATRGAKPVIIPQGKFRIIKDVGARAELEQWEARAITRVKNLPDSELAEIFEADQIASEIAENQGIFEDPFGHVAPGLNTDIVAKYGPVNPENFPVWDEMVERVRNSADQEGAIARLVGGLSEQTPVSPLREDVAQELRDAVRTLAYPPTTPGAPVAPVTPAVIGTARTGQQFSGTLFRGSGRKTLEEVYDPHYVQGPILGQATYATSIREFAQEFGPQVDEIQITLKNPLVIASDREWKTIARQADLFSDVPISHEEIARLRQTIQAKGHDGVIIRVPKSEATGKTLQKAFDQDTVVSFVDPPTPQVAPPTPPVAPVTPGAQPQRTIKELIDAGGGSERIALEGRANYQSSIARGEKENEQLLRRIRNQVKSTDYITDNHFDLVLQLSDESLESLEGMDIARLVRVIGDASEAANRRAVKALAKADELTQQALESEASAIERGIAREVPPGAAPPTPPMAPVAAEPFVLTAKPPHRMKIPKSLDEAQDQVDEVQDYMDDLENRLGEMDNPDTKAGERLSERIEEAEAYKDQLDEFIDAEEIIEEAARPPYTPGAAPTPPVAPVTPGARATAARAAREAAGEAPQQPRQLEFELDAIVPDEQASDFIKASDPSGGGPPPGNPPIPGASAADDIFEEIRRLATPDEVGKATITLMRRHQGAVNVASRAAIELAQAGEKALNRLGLSVTRGTREAIRESSIPEMDTLFKALHGEGEVPLRLRGVYDELKALTDWEQASRIDFDPDMATVSDYFYRGWKMSEDLAKAFRKFRNRGAMGWPPGFQEPRVNATYSQMRELGFEPLSWNPFEQWRISYMQGMRHRQQSMLLDRLKHLELAKPWAGGVIPKGWRIPEVGPAFEGRWIKNIDKVTGESSYTKVGSYIVESRSPLNSTAARLDSLYGKRPDWKVDIAGREIDLMKVIDAITFIPKRAKLMFSFFQQQDFLSRSLIGTWSQTVDQLLAGKPIDAVKTLATWPTSAINIIRANLSPNYRQLLKKELTSTTELIPGRPGVHFKGMIEAGLSIRDVNIFPQGLDELAQSVAEDSGLLGVKAVARLVNQVESAMRRGLFEGVYPAAQMTDIKNNIVHMVVKKFPNATDEQINGIVARMVNVKYSTIPESQSVLQGRLLRGVLQRVFFSVGESEGLLRQGTGLVTGPYKALWAKHWLGAYLALIATANVIHFASTGKVLPADRWKPISKDSWGSLSFGYRRDFAAPTLPIKGRGGTELTLDIVGQMDTVFRILDPLAFISARESVPVRTIVNQWKGTDFFDAPIDEVGPGGIASRTAALLTDMFAPIGVGTAGVGIAREQIPALGKLLPPGEERIGTAGQVMQMPGLNVRGETTPNLRDRKARESGYLIEDPTNPERHGTPVRTWEDLTNPQERKLLESDPEFQSELEEREKIGAIREQQSALEKRGQQRATVKLVKGIETTTKAFLSDPSYGEGFVPSDARKEIRSDLDDYYEEVYGRWDESTQRMVGGIFESEEAIKEPEEGTTEHLLWRYRTRYDHLKGETGDINWGKLTDDEWEDIEMANNEFWADVTPAEANFVIRETNDLWKDFEEPARRLLEAARYAGAFTVTLEGEDVGYQYWGLIRHPEIEDYLVKTSKASLNDIREYLDKSSAAKKAARTNPKGRRIDRAITSAQVEGGPLWFKRKQFIKNAPTIWIRAMIDAGYHYLDKDKKRGILDRFRVLLKEGGTDFVASPETYQRLYIEQLSAR